MTNTAVVLTVLGVLIVGGALYYVGQRTAPTKEVTTPSTNSVNTQTTSGVPKPPVRTPGAPIVTTNSTVVASDTTAAVGGTVIPNGGSTTYWYEYGPSPELGNKTAGPSQAIGFSYSSISAPGFITDLTKNTRYYFRLVAENQYGRTAGTQYSFQTTQGNPPPVGSIPTIRTLAANEVTRTGANLNGEVTPNRAATQYWFEYGKTPNLGEMTAFASVGDGTAKLSASVSVSDLDPLTTYYFRLNAQNRFGTVNGTILSFRTTGPALPAAPAVTTRSASNIGTTSATLRGNVNPNGAETTYWFEYSTDSLLGSLLLNSTEPRSAGDGSSTRAVEMDVSGLSAKVDYYFRIVAQNSFGTVRGDRMTFRTK